MSDSTSQQLQTEKSFARPTPPAGGRKHRYWWWIVILILLIAGIFIVWRHRTSSSTTTASAGGRGGAGFGPLMVSTVKAQTGDIGIYVNALGVVTPLNTVSIVSRVQGQITKIYYQEGQTVNVGDPLVEIDPGPNQAALLQAEGQLARDMALLENARLDWNATMKRSRATRFRNSSWTRRSPLCIKTRAR